MKNILVVFGLVFILVAALSLTGCGDKGGEDKVGKTAEEIKAEKAKAYQDKWKAIVAKKRNGETSSPEARTQTRATDRPEAKASSGSETVSTVRLEYVRKDGLPGNYAGLSTPLKGSREDMVKGRDLYNRNCAACHGVRGAGESAMGRRLKPPASNLLVVSGLPEATDGYFFWAVSDGGRALRPMTAMPSFRQLSEEDRWRSICALRNGLR